jgi:hydroxymethylglutaryl-CoA lyase
MQARNEEIIVVDCPRDAIQGITHFISTQKKVEYLNGLLKSQLFDWIDFGSFVSPKAVPQMADTKEVLDRIVLNSTKLLAIVVNERGALEACNFDKITYLGYPFSISEVFQKRNTQSTIEESFEKLKNIVEISKKHAKTPVVYISMAFGNPYGEVWSKDLVFEWIKKIAALGVVEFSLADTTGEANKVQIKELFEFCIQKFPSIRIGAHFHSEKTSSLEKIKTAFEAGCRKFDGAILGFGGCPFANNDLVGNIPTEDLLRYFKRGSEQQILELQTSFQNMIA